MKIVGLFYAFNARSPMSVQAEGRSPDLRIVEGSATAELENISGDPKVPREEEARQPGGVGARGTQQATPARTPAFRCRGMPLCRCLYTSIIEV